MIESFDMWHVSYAKNHLQVAMTITYWSHTKLNWWADSRDQCCKCTALLDSLHRRRIVLRADPVSDFRNLKNMTKLGTPLPKAIERGWWATNSKFGKSSRMKSCKNFFLRRWQSGERGTVGSHSGEQVQLFAKQPSPPSHSSLSSHLPLPHDWNLHCEPGVGL